MRLIDIARVCHEANRALQLIQGDPVPSPEWAEASESQKESAVYGVFMSIVGKSPEELHQSWCDFKVDNGWEYGENKDEEKKTHPCLVPYEELPEEQKAKDVLFNAIVTSLTPSK